MAEERNKGDTPYGAPVTQGEVISDILLILDKMELLLQAVSEINRNGAYRTVPADAEHRSSFLRIDKYSNMVENFLKNFWSQLRDPTRFQLFRMKDPDLDDPKNRAALADLAAGRETDAVKDFLKKYEIVPKHINQNQKEMAKQTETPQAGGAAVAAEKPKYRFVESMINWEQLKNFGLSREYLQERGLLDLMLRGYKTNTTVPISMNFGSAVLRTDARLSFQQSIGGPVVLAIHGIRKEPDLERPYFGHIFSDEDRRNLRETGNMGRVVELRSNSGEYYPSFISLDKLTNEVVSMRAENVAIPKEIKGVELTKQEREDLSEGKAIFVEGMQSKNGKDFDAYVQISADKRGIEFSFPNDKLFTSKILGGVELTDMQIKELNEGKAIFVEDMQRKDGELFSAFVKLDEATGRPAYTRYNPDSPEDAREIYVPKEINGVKLTHDDREQLRAGKPVFLEDMINRRGEQYSSFVKLDLRTGAPMYSKTRDGFEERREFKVPTELWGVTLSATQRAQLQDGKAVLVEGMRGYDGSSFSQYAKVNFYQGRINYYNENPDHRRGASQRNVVAEAQKRAQAEKKDTRKSQGKSLH